MEDAFDTPGVRDAPVEAPDQEALTDNESEGPSTDADETNDGDQETRYSLRPRDPDTGLVRTSGTEAASESLMFVGTEGPSEAETAAGIEFFHPFGKLGTTCPSSTRLMIENSQGPTS